MGFRRCSGDKNNVEALLKFPNGAIFFEAKMSLDIDGSFKACSNTRIGRPVPDLAHLAQPYRQGQLYELGQNSVHRHSHSRSRPVEERVSGSKTGVKAGDFAVVVFNGHVVPAMVGDGGPFNKLGEASNAVFKAVGKDRCRETNSQGHCIRYLDASLESDVLYFVFPGTASRSITPANALEMIKSAAGQKFETLKASQI